MPSNIKVKCSRYHLAFIGTDAQTHVDRAKAKSHTSLGKPLIRAVIEPVANQIDFQSDFSVVSSGAYVDMSDFITDTSVETLTFPIRTEHANCNKDHTEDDKMHCS